VIPKLFDIKDYGFISTDFVPASSSSAKLPAGLQIQCWEAKELEIYFSKEQCETLMSRREERNRARAECLRLLEAMDDVEKMELLKGEKGEEKEKVLKKAIEV